MSGLISEIWRRTNKRPAGFPTGLMIMVGHQHSRPEILAQGEPDL